MSAIRILIVDDLPDMRMLLKMTLKRMGWQILEAQNGQEAITVAQAEQPDLILMDFDMPIMNGAEACANLTTDEATSHIPVLIYTGHSASHIESLSYESGAVAFLVKPITPDQLRGVVGGYLQSASEA